MQKEKIEYQQLVSALTLNLNGLVAIYLHGSVLKGQERPDSDLDIALLMFPDQFVSFDNLVRLAGDLELLMYRPVHLSVLSNDQIVFAKEVIVNGKKLYCADEMYCNEFEMYGLSACARLNDDRRKVLESYCIKLPEGSLHE